MRRRRWSRYQREGAVWGLFSCPDAMMIILMTILVNDHHNKLNSHKHEIVTIFVTMITIRIT